MVLLAEEPQVMEFRSVPQVTEEVQAELTQSEAQIALYDVLLELGSARARLARAVGVRSLEKMK
jgi:hypothetical protein